MKEWAELDRKALRVFDTLGVALRPVTLPDDLPVGALSWILTAEAAAAFDDLTRSDRDDLLVRQGEDSWPNRFRTARLIPAVEYIQANRVRLLVMQAMGRVMQQVDLYVAPSLASRSLWLTNLTGHPAVAVPNGLRTNGLPSTITFTGRLFDEQTLLAAAMRYQDATDFHRQLPPFVAQSLHV